VRVDIGPQLREREKAPSLLKGRGAVLMRGTCEGETPLVAVEAVVGRESGWAAK